MVVSVSSNLNSRRAQRHLSEISNELSHSFERLSSGLRINRASDDAAGISISSGLSTDARVYAQATRNVNDAISALNISEGSLDAITGILYRQRELSTQAANGSLSFKQRSSLHAEYKALVDEYNRLVRGAEFNGRKLLESAGTALGIQAGYGTDGSLSISLAQQFSRTSGNGTFSSGSNYLSEGGPSPAPEAMIAADFDRDGDIDIASAGVQSNEVHIQLNNGNGTFGLATYQYAIGTLPRDMRLGDFNGDGISDIATIDAGSNNISVLIGNGNGSFRSAASYAMAGAGYGITTGDFNRDGRDDIAIGQPDSASVSVYLANSNGTFGPSVNYSAGTAGIQAPWAMRSGDFNNDGIPDLATSLNSSTGQIGIFLGAGNGTFGTVIRTDVGIDNPAELALGDFNDDGNLDVVTGGILSSLSVMLGTGNGSFSSPTLYAVTGSYTNALEAADMNGDGVTDVVAGQTGSGRGMNVFIGNGNGTFASGASITPLEGPTDFVLEDLNGDGARDIGVAYMWLASGATGVHLGGTVQRTTEEYAYLYTRAGALSAMDSLDLALARVSNEKSVIGSFQSRLKSAFNTLTVSRENFKAAEGRISSADVAQESALLVRNQIRQQAASAVLAQANAQPEIALQLLQGI